jgi:hypothetical protein
MKSDFSAEIEFSFLYSLELTLQTILFDIWYVTVIWNRVCCIVRLGSKVEVA